MSNDGSVTHVWWCKHCAEQVGTTMGEPDECPTCGNEDEWKYLTNRHD